MASSSSSASPSAATFSSPTWKYHVFLSFRGEDTRKTFVDHLYSALQQQGVYTYKDDETLPRGESIGPSLVKAIEESQIAVIIFSENYADSSWCLDELACIMKCKDTKGQIVMPVFYGVDPSEVRKQKRKYGEAFAKHELENKKKIKSWRQAVVEDPWGWLSAPREQKRKYQEAFAKDELENKAKVESWRKALVDASNISGWEPKHVANGHESRVIKEIVDTISQRLQLVTSSANENLIGMAARMQRLKSELKIGSLGVHMIGIWGVGGGGKTTLASSIYDEISRKFDGSCFVKNTRQESSKNGLEKLQEKILSGVLKQTHVQVIERVEEGMRMIADRLCHRKVLIVLDDVDHLDQLKALAGSHDWFGEGSRIIITTRDVHLLNARRVDVMHNISLLNDDEAIKLFCKLSPQDYRPKEDYERLSKEVVSYAGGLPLAITVLGPFLCDKDIDEWRSALARLKEIPNDDIVGKLKISFDGLTKVEKDLFLDIACFFRREDKDEAMAVLDACGFHPVIGVKVLVQKALITISKDGEIDMHDLVQEMGHYIVRGEHPKNPEKHSRLWGEDIAKICVVDAKTELDMIEAIQIDHNDLVHKEDLPPIGANLKNLRYIKWRGDPANPMLNNFPSRELCCLKLHGGLQKQLWEGCKLLPNLKMMELWWLHNLITTPDFKGLPNLERFILDGCKCLEEIHPSFGRLERLVILSIEHCYRLKMFPPITRLKKLKTLSFSAWRKLLKIQQNIEYLNKCDPDDPFLPYGDMDNIRLWFFHNLKEHGFLRELDLSWCNLGDEDVGSDVWELPNLQVLYLKGNKFSRLSFSQLRLPRLKFLDVSNCNRLVEMSDLPSSIAVFQADLCKSLERFGNTSNCKWMWKVSLHGSYKVDPLDGYILLDSMLQGNAIEDHLISVSLSHRISNRLVGRLFRGDTFTMHLPHVRLEPYNRPAVRPHSNTFTLRLPDDWYKDFCGFLICVVTDPGRPQIDIIIKQEEGDEEDSRFEVWQESNEAPELEYDGEVMTHLGYVSFNSLRHTTSLDPSYNIISFYIHDTYWTSFAAELVPWKSKDDTLQTTKVAIDSSEFRDDGETFTIEHDSKSCIKILWQGSLLQTELKDSYPGV